MRKNHRNRHLHTKGLRIISLLLVFTVVFGMSDFARDISFALDNTDNDVMVEQVEEEIETVDAQMEAQEASVTEQPEQVDNPVVSDKTEIEKQVEKADADEEQKETPAPKKKNLFKAPLLGGEEVPVSEAVWYYAPGATEPTGKVATLSEAIEAINKITTSTAKNPSVIEVHRDIEQNTNIGISKHVTFRSAPGEKHTITFNLSSNGYGLNMLSPVTVNFGEDNGGVLTIDMNGKGYAVNAQRGNVNVYDGIRLVNGNSRDYGGAIRAVVHKDGSYAKSINIYGGIFENNHARYGGAIHIGSTDTEFKLYGGTFTGNSAEAIDNLIGGHAGNAIYRSNGDIHISGSPSFGSEQDIYLTSNGSSVSVTDAVSIKVRLLKDGPITSVNPIPVRIGGAAQKNIYWGRDILINGADTVVSGDATKFTIVNSEDTKAQYLALGYTESDFFRKKAVIELVSEITDNMENFIDEDYVNPKENGTRNKTARWLDEDKSQAEILITDESSTKPVLVIGPLCSAHGISNDNLISSVINKAAENNDVDYCFGATTASGPSQIEQGIAGKKRGPVEGSLAKGSKTKKSFTCYSGAHDSVEQFAEYLVEKLQEKKYSEIIMMFDNASITVLGYKAYTPETQKNLYKVANLLKPYYENGEVTWISAAKMVVDYDYETPKRTNIDIKASDGDPKTLLLLKTCYSTNESLLHYGTEPVEKKENALMGKYDKFNKYFSMALFDPATWLQGVENRTIPEWSDYNLNTRGALYNKEEDITNAIDSIFNRDEVVIDDVVTADLPINNIHAESSSDGGTTWTDITGESGVTLTRDGQNVHFAITNETYIDTLLRVRIVCDCPGEFKEDGNEPKDTNVGDAMVTYKQDGEAEASYPIPSPKLLKIWDTIKVKKTVYGQDTGEAFPFSYSYVSSLDGQTVDGTFDLKSGESFEFKVPTKSTDVEITETSHEGYETSYEINGEEIAEGDSVSMDVFKPAVIEFYNVDSGSQIPKIKVTKVFEGISLDDIEAMKATFKLMVESKEDPSKKKELRLTDPDVEVSEDGMTYTWYLNGFPSGEYNVKETGAEVAGFYMDVEGTGDVDTRKSKDGSPGGELPVSGDYSDVEDFVINIADDVKNTGNISASFKCEGTDVDLPDGYHLEWFKSLDGSSWEKIPYTEFIAGGKIISNITDDTKSVNIVLTDGERTDEKIVQYKAVIYSDEGGKTSIESASFIQDDYWGKLRNGSFEEPDITTLSGKPDAYLFQGGSTIFGAQVKSGSNGVIWKSAIEAKGENAGHDIEIARVGTDGEKQLSFGAYHDVPGEDYHNFNAADGVQFAEINSEVDGALYQDVLTEPGTTLYWSLSHRARHEYSTPIGAKDTMYVVSMATVDAEKFTSGEDMRAAVKTIMAGDPENKYPGAKVWTVSDDESAWKHHDNADDGYVIPDDQYLTRLFFVATQENAVGRLNAGNLIDCISYNTTVLPPGKGYANVVLKKNISGALSTEQIEQLREDIVFNYEYAEETGSITGSDDMLWAATGQGSYTMKIPVSGEYMRFSISEENADIGTFVRNTKYENLYGSLPSITADGKYGVTVRSGDTVVITVDNDYASDVEVINKYEPGVILPDTGGDGMFMLILAGLLCIMAGLTYAYRSRRRCL